MPHLNRLCVVVCLLLTLVACTTPAPAAPPAAATDVPATMETEMTEATPAGEEMPAEDEEPIATTFDVVPVLETQPVVDMDEAPDGERLGDADDPAIWVHPTDPAQSIVVTVLKEGGMEVYDLDGNVLQSVIVEGARYNNVDLVYNFSLGGEMVDLAVATDRYEDKLVVFRIDPATRELTDVTYADNPLVFTAEGEESDEETTAYGVGTYTSPTTGRYYAFVSRRDTNEAAQLELIDNGDGTVSSTIVRSFTVDAPADEEASPQIEGIVADPALGVVYMGQEDVGIWKFQAEADAPAEGTLIHSVDNPDSHLSADVEGLTIYFGPGTTGYLLSSSQGDNTFAVYDREGDNAYISSFTVVANGEIDSAEESDGAHVVSVALGDRYPNGLLVVQDGQNDPAVMVEDDGEMENASTSFKFVPWEAVAEPGGLIIDTTGWSPR